MSSKSGKKPRWFRVDKKMVEFNEAISLEEALSDENVADQRKRRNKYLLLGGSLLVVGTAGGFFFLAQGDPPPVIPIGILPEEENPGIEQSPTGGPGIGVNRGQTVEPSDPVEGTPIEVETYTLPDGQVILGGYDATNYTLSQEISTHLQTKYALDSAEFWYVVASAPDLVYYVNNGKDHLAYQVSRTNGGFADNLYMSTLEDIQEWSDNFYELWNASAMYQLYSQGELFQATGPAYSLNSLQQAVPSDVVIVLDAAPPNLDGAVSQFVQAVSEGNQFAHAFRIKVVIVESEDNLMDFQGLSFDEVPGDLYNVATNGYVTK